MKHTINALCAALALLAAACSGTPRSSATDPAYANAPPKDFTLALTVLSPESSHANPKIPRAARPARYVMEADWLLRAAFGPDIGENTFPRQTRQLTQAQAHQLWQGLSGSELIDPAHATRTGSWQGEAPEAGDPTYILSYSLNGDRRTYAIDDSASPEARDAARRLADRFAQLAWVKEATEPRP